DRGVAGVGDGHLALEVPGPAVVGGPEGGRAVTVGRRRGLLVRGGGGRAGGAAARADTRDLAVAAVEDDVRAAEEVLVAVGALPVDVQDVVTALAGRKSGVPVVVAEPARGARLRRVGHLGELLQVAPAQRAVGVPPVLGDVQVERARVVRPVAVPDLDVGARRQVRLRPVVPDRVVGAEVVRAAGTTGRRRT